jgi:hypothetical protein
MGLVDFGCYLDQQVLLKQLSIINNQSLDTMSHSPMMG